MLSEFYNSGFDLRQKNVSSEFTLVFFIKFPLTTTGIHRYSNFLHRNKFSVGYKDIILIRSKK